jgi:hypothetical protein
MSKTSLILERRAMEKADFDSYGGKRLECAAKQFMASLYEFMWASKNNMCHDNKSSYIKGRLWLKKDDGIFFQTCGRY